MRSLKNEDREAHLEIGDTSYFLIADGHGGPEAAERAASSLLGEIVSRSADEPLEAAMRAAFHQLHLEVQKKYTGAGATCTVIAINRSTREVTCANVGDSQGYLVLPGNSPGDLIALGTDHRLDTNVEERQRVLNAGAKIGRAVHPSTGQPSGPLRAFPGGLAMGRSLGDQDCGEWISGEPSCSQTRLLSEGGRVVVCSDGVWDALNPEVVARLVRENAPPDTAAHNVVAAAIKARGLRDDTTCTVVAVGDQSLFGTDAALAKGRSDRSPMIRRFGKLRGRVSTDSTYTSDDSSESHQGDSSGSHQGAESAENFSVKGGRLFAHMRRSPTGSPSASRDRTPDHSPQGLAAILQLVGTGRMAGVSRQGVKLDANEEQDAASGAQ